MSSPTEQAVPLSQTLPESNHVTKATHQKKESSDKPAPRQKKAEGTEKVFCCKFCGKKFNNLQAAGGHQNAHKNERALLKRQKLMLDNNIGSLGPSPTLGNIDPRLYPHHPSCYNYNPWLGMASQPQYIPRLYGPVSRNLGQGLGVQPHSMIHKPYSNTSTNLACSGHGYQPTMHRLQSLLAAEGNGAFLLQAKPIGFSSAGNEGGSSAPTLGLGDQINYATCLGSSSSSKNDPQSEDTSLDLTLKL